MYFYVSMDHYTVSRLTGQHNAFGRERRICETCGKKRQLVFHTSKCSHIHILYFVFRLVLMCPSNSTSEIHCQCHGELGDFSLKMSALASFDVGTVHVSYTLCRTCYLTHD